MLFGFPLRVSRPQGLYFSRRGEVLPRRQGGRMSCFSRADEITRTVISPPSIFPEVLAVSRRRGLCLALCQTAVSVRETPFVYDFQRHFRPRFVTSFLPLNMRKPCKFPKLTRLSAYSVLLPTLSARYNISARACACVRFCATSFCAARLFSHGFPVACDFCPPGSKIWHAFLTWFFRLL